MRASNDSVVGSRRSPCLDKGRKGGWGVESLKAPKLGDASKRWETGKRKTESTAAKQVWPIEGLARAIRTTVAAGDDAAAAE